MPNFSVHSSTFDPAHFKDNNNQDVKFKALLVLPPRGQFLNGHRIKKSPLWGEPLMGFIGPERESERGRGIAGTIEEGQWTLEYAFSNGLCLSWNELIKKELVHLVPTEIKPTANVKTLNEVRNVSKLFYWSADLLTFTVPDDPVFRVHAGVVNIFKQLSSLQKDFTIYFAIAEQQHRNCWLVDEWQWDLEIETPPTWVKLNTKSGQDRNVLLIQEEENRFDFLNGFWIPEKKLFCFHDLYRQYHPLLTEKYCFEQPISPMQGRIERYVNPHFQEAAFQLKNGNDTRRLWIKAHHASTNIYEFLRSFKFEVISDLEIIKIENLKAQVLVEIVNEDEEFKQNVKVQLETDQGIKIEIPYPEELMRLQRGILFGFSAYYGESHLALATHKKDKRKYELKLFKHPGIFSYVILETLNNIFQGQTVEGIKGLGQQALKEYILKKLSPLLHPEGLSIDVLLTQPTMRMMRDFIDDIYQHMENVVDIIFEDDDKVYDFCIREIHNFKLVYTQLKALAEGPQALAFRKERHPVWQQAENTEIFQLPQDWQTISEWILLIQQESIALKFNEENLNRLLESDIEFKIDVQMSTSDQDRDWFSLHPAVYFGGVEIPAEEVAQVANSKIFKHQGKLYVVDLKQVPKMKTLVNLWGKIFAVKNKAKKREVSYLKIPKTQFLELMALENLGVKIQGDAEWLKIKGNFNKLIKRKELEPEIKNDSILKDYQLHGVQWLRDLYSIQLGGILADDMGLGKTLQTLKFLQHLDSAVKHNILVVVPPSLLHNWEQERKKFTNNLKLTFFNPQNKSDYLNDKGQFHVEGILLCTYGLLTEHKEFFASAVWNIVIFDEAQALKNIKSQRTTVARMLKAKFKLALTGTPMENRLQEFYSLIDLVAPGALGELSEFVQRYVSGDSLNLDLSTLKTVVRPLLMRRMKSEVQLELPDKIESTVVLPLEEEQKKIYKNIALSMNKEVEQSIQTQGVESSQLKMLVALMRLRQVCSDPRGLPNVKYTEQPAKFDYILSKIDEVIQAGNSCLVFTQFLSTFENLKSEFNKASIKNFSICGADSAQQRKNTLNAFENEPGASVLLMTLKTGGVGLNLTKASYVFHIEPWWNPAVENQATDRAHRLGQNKTVNVYRLILKDTLEEKIQELKLEKARLFEQLFSDNEQGSVLKSSGLLTKDDFKYLIEGPLS
jgi:hypothetical protein